MDLRELRSKIEANWNASRPVRICTDVVGSVQAHRVYCTSAEAAGLMTYLFREADVILERLERLEHLERVMFMKAGYEPR